MAGTVLGENFSINQWYNIGQYACCCLVDGEKTCPLTSPSFNSFSVNLIRDDPYITSYILEVCLTPPPPPYCHQSSYFGIPPLPLLPSYSHILTYSFHINIKSAFIFNPSKITFILFSLINDPYLYARDHLRSNCKPERSFPKFGWSLLVYLQFFSS